MGWGMRARGASSRKSREGSQMGLRAYPWEAPEHEQERVWRHARGRGRRVRSRARDAPVRIASRGCRSGGRAWSSRRGTLC